MNKGRKEERKQWQVAAVRDLPYNDPEISDIFAQRGRQPARHEKIMPPIVLGELCPCVCVCGPEAGMFQFQTVVSPEIALLVLLYVLYKPKL